MSYETACAGKVRYATKGKAMRARQLHRQRMIYYFCPFCRGYHLSSKCRTWQQAREDKIEAVVRMLREKRANGQHAALPLPAK